MGKLIRTKFDRPDAYYGRYYFGGGGGGGGDGVKYDNLERLYEEQAASARLLRGIAETSLPGATGAYVGEVQNVLAPDFAERRANLAGADMAGANAMERAATERNLASMGVNPNDPRFASSMRSTQLSNAARMAAGKNLTRNEADQYQLNVAKDAVGTFTGQSNNAATQMGNAASGLGSIYTSKANQQMAQDQAQSQAVGNVANAGLTAYAMLAKDGGKVTGIGLKKIERHMVGGQAGSQQNQGFFQMQSIAPPPSAQAPQQQGGGISMNQVMMAKRIADKQAKEKAADAAGKAFADDVAAKTVESTMPAAAEAATTDALTNAAGQTFAENVAANTAAQAGAVEGGAALGSGLANTAATAAGEAAIGGSVTTAAGAAGTGAAAGGSTALAGGAGAAAGGGAMATIGAALPWVGAAYAVGSLLDWWNEGGQVGTQNKGMSEEEAMRRFSEAFNAGDVNDLRAGGDVPGEWKENRDTVPAMLVPDEFVLNAEASALMGDKELERLNAKGLALREQGVTPHDIRRGIGLRGLKKRSAA